MQSIKSIKAVLLIFTVLPAIVAHAQDDSDAGVFFGSYPENGSWFAMDDSNTGFFLDVQNGRLAGAYFGFNDDGDNVWLLLNGELQPLFDLTLPEIQIGWQLETTLTQSANGGCILNCDDDTTPPHMVNGVAEIMLQFEGRSRGQFSIDGNDLVDIIPLYFGTPAILSDQTAGLTAQPDLQGTWVIVMGTGVRNADLTVADINMAESAAIIEIGEQQSDVVGPIGIPPAVITNLITTAPIISDTTGIFPENSKIVCSYLQELSEPADETIECKLIGGDLNVITPNGGTLANAPIQMMSDSRFLVYINSISDGITDPLPPITRIEAFKTSYD